MRVHTNKTYIHVANNTILSTIFSAPTPLVNSTTPHSHTQSLSNAHYARVTSFLPLIFATYTALHLTPSAAIGTQARVLINTVPAPIRSVGPPIRTSSVSALIDVGHATLARHARWALPIDGVHPYH